MSLSGNKVARVHLDSITTRPVAFVLGADWTIKSLSIVAGFAGGIVVAFFVVMPLIATGRTGPLRERRWLMLGALSYPLYLAHPFLGCIVFNEVSPAIGVQLTFWGMIVPAIALAYAVHRKRLS